MGTIFLGAFPSEGSEQKKNEKSSNGPAWIITIMIECDPWS